MKTALIILGVIFLFVSLFCDMAGAPRYETLLMISGLCATVASGMFAFSFTRWNALGKLTCGIGIILALSVLLDIFRRSLS